MKFTIFAAVAAFASFVAAQSNAITAPIGGAVSAGKPTTITWQPSDQGTITLTLRSGDGNALNTVATIASNIPNTGSYTWTPPSSIPSASDYTIEIASTAAGSTSNYSARFSVTGGSASSAAASSGSASTTGISNLPTVTLSANASSATTMSNSSSASTTTGKSKPSMTAMASGSSSTGSSAPAPSNAAMKFAGNNGGFAAAVVGLAGLVALI